MTDRDAFLAAIHATPDDDAPRLIFADWLDEHGESERAEFIRIQVEMRRERETHDCVTTRLDELFRRQKQLFQCAWADSARQCGAARTIGYYSRGFPNFLQPTARTFVEFAEEIPLWIGPNTEVDLFECQDALQAVGQSPAMRSVRRLHIGTGWADNTHTDDDIVAFLTSPYLENLREFRLSNPIVRRNSTVEPKPLTSKVAIAIASAASLTRLASLNLSQIQIRSAGVSALARQERLASLRELHLDNTGLTKRGVDALCKSPHLRGLVKLDVRGNQLSPDDIARLNERFPAGVVVGDQQTQGNRRLVR